MLSNSKIVSIFFIKLSIEYSLAFIISKQSFRSNPIESIFCAHALAVLSKLIKCTLPVTFVYLGTAPADVMQFNPAVCASKRTIPNPSCLDGNTKKSIACK